MQAGGGRQEEPERDAADLDALPQRVGHAGQPDRPRRPHDRRAPACPVHVHPAPVTVAAVPMLLLVVVVAAAAVRARGEEQGCACEVERRSWGKGEELGPGLREGRGS